MKNKINVNISPNPLDLQTLHCSQNDTSERKFYFTLHNNGEVIDTTDISDPIFEPFDVYKGGTEQILPVNTDDPTTSPIIADIQYPDEEKTEQEFTYRESPTTIDGKALVEKIKGNTIVWNQISDNLYNSGTSNDVEFTHNSDGSWNIVGTASTTIIYRLSSTITLVKDHKYIVIGSFTGGGSNTYSCGLGGLKLDYGGGLLVWNNSAGYTGSYASFNISQGTTVNLTNVRVSVFDITKMFGETKANEIYQQDQSVTSSGVAYFRSLFPLPYYQYDAGSLLSFNGTGIKTVGFNQWDEEWEQGTINAQGQPIGDFNNIRSKNFISALASTEYYAKCPSTVSLLAYYYDGNKNFISGVVTVGNQTFTTPSNCCYLKIRTGSYGGTYNYDICINISSDRNGEYEPYTTSTTTIPTDTYFPTGMKSAGTVYDELTNSKAITRIGEVDLGSINWSRNTSGTNPVFIATISDATDNTQTDAITLSCSLYTPIGAKSLTGYQSVSLDKTICKRTNNLTVMVQDSSYTDPTTFNSAMNGVMLQYELAEEQVVNFTHASLVCEDGESALYHDDDSLACECTEDFSKDSGFKDCKIKITNDDGVVYSNKIQLHIERKP